MLDYYHAGYPGSNNSIVSNSIINTEGGAITVWSTFKDFTIRDNYIENSSQGIWIYDDLFGELTNGFIVNNIVKNVTGNTISAYAGYTISIKNIQIVEALELPPIKIHCSVLAEDSIKQAIEDYETKQ